MRVNDSEHDDFVNEILENAPESYDGDDAAESIAIRYVRDLEAMRDSIAKCITPIVVQYIR